MERIIKKLFANFEVCLVLISSLDLNDSANFQCGKASSSHNVYYWSIIWKTQCLKLKNSPFAVFERVLKKCFWNEDGARNCFQI